MVASSSRWSGASSTPAFTPQPRCSARRAGSLSQTLRCSFSPSSCRHCSLRGVGASGRRGRGFWLWWWCRCRRCAGGWCGRSSRWRRSRLLGRRWRCLLGNTCPLAGDLTDEVANKTNMQAAAEAHTPRVEGEAARRGSEAKTAAALALTCIYLHIYVHGASRERESKSMQDMAPSRREGGRQAWGLRQCT